MNCRPHVALIAVGILASLWGCSERSYPPPTAAPVPSAQPPFPVKDLAAALTDVVDGGAGTVDYKALRAHRAPLNRYVALLAVSGPRASPHLFPGRDHAKAYHLNAYNAFVLHGVVSEDEGLTSVLEIGVLRSFFWWSRFRLDSDWLTLLELENDVIRPTYRDARVHFAINCASVSCPALEATPFVAEGLDLRLDQATRRFLARPDTLAIDVPGRRVTLSELFQWYEEDFAGWPLAPGGRPPGDVLTWVFEFLSADRKAQLRAACGPRLTECAVDHFSYDWSLNSRR